MIPYLIAAIGGAYLANKRAPKSKCIKRECIGPRSGLVFQVEEWPDNGIIMVRFISSKGNAYATLKRGENGFEMISAKGNEGIINMIIEDFGLNDRTENE